MSKKATGDHTRAQRAAALPPLEDDERWLPLIEVTLPQMIKRTGNARLAVLDLEQALAQGRMRCMIRSINTGERKMLEPAAWNELLRLHPLGFGEHAPWGVVNRGPPDDSYLLKVKVFAGWLFYIWQPDFEILWPTTKAEAEPQPMSDKPKGDGWQVARVKQLLPIVHPNGVPANATDKDVLVLLVPEYKKRGWKVPSTDTIARARGRRQ